MHAGCNPTDPARPGLQPYVLRVQVVATLQCGGNRRGDLDVHKRTSGNSWGAGEG